MSELPTSVTTTPAPERGSADVDGDMPEVTMATIDSAPTSEQEADATKMSLRERIEIVNKLQPNVGSFTNLLKALPEEGEAYNSYNDFSGLIEGKMNSAELNRELTEPENVVLEYLKSEYWTKTFEQTVDFESFERASLAFPGIEKSPKLAKAEYIIEDLENALAKEQNPERKVALNYDITSMEAFVAILKGESVESTGNEIRNYAELLNDKNADPQEFEEARKTLFDLKVKNFAQGAAYKIISDYFPADDSKDGIVSHTNTTEIDDIVAKYDRESATILTSTNSKTSGSEEKTTAQKSGETIIDNAEQLTFARGKVAEVIAKRLDSRKPYGFKESDIHKWKFKHIYSYDTANWKLFEEQNGDPEMEVTTDGTTRLLNDARTDILVAHIAKEVTVLKDAVQAISQRDFLSAWKEDDIIDDIEMLVDKYNHADESEYAVFKNVQTDIYKMFENVIRDEREGKRQRALEKVTDIAIGRPFDALIARNIRRDKDKQNKSKRAPRVKNIVNLEKVGDVGRNVGGRIKSERVRKLGRKVSSLARANSARY
ncbi:MAG: hypothetical protein WAW80_02675 [Candidatus Saccharimonadales bacterium]